MQGTWRDSSLTQQREFGLPAASGTHESTARAIVLESSSLFGALLAAKVKVRSGQSIDEAVASINALERELKARVPNLKWCFIEPDAAD